MTGSESFHAIKVKYITQYKYYRVLTLPYSTHSMHTLSFQQREVLKHLIASDTTNRSYLMQVLESYLHFHKEMKLSYKLKHKKGDTLNLVTK